MAPQSPRYRPPGSSIDARRARRRIVTLLLALGLVLIAIFEASQPANWEWFVRLSRDAPGAAQSAPPRSAAEFADAPLAPDQVRIVAPGGDARSGTSAPGPAPGEGHAARSARNDLSAVRDDVVGVRHSESAAYYALLAEVRAAPADSLRRAARADVTYAALLNDPERYRGELLTLTGELRRFTPLSAAGNAPADLGLTTLYEGWMFTDEAGRKSPYCLVCSQKPAGFPEGDEIRERVEFTGCFFKRVAYETAHGLHSAPMLLGRDVRWLRQPPRAGRSWRSALFLALALAALAAAFAVTMWRLAAGDRAARSAHGIHTPEPGAADLAALARAEPTDPGAFLEKLSRDENSG